MDASFDGSPPTRLEVPSRFRQMSTRERATATGNGAKSIATVTEG